MCVHAINAPSTPGWWKCICRVFTAGCQVSSRPALTLTCTQALFVRRVGESMGGGVHPERKASGRGGTMVAMDTTAGRGAPACRVAPPSGEVALRSAGGGVTHCLLKHTNAKEELKKKFSSSVPSIVPQTSPPV